MAIIKNMAPQIARKLLEPERIIIRTWDLQRHGKAAPHAEHVTDEQADSSAQMLEDVAESLPLEEREDIQRLVRIVRSLLEFAADKAWEGPQCR